MGVEIVYIFYLMTSFTPPSLFSLNSSTPHHPKKMLNQAQYLKVSVLDTLHYLTFLYILQTNLEGSP